MVIDPLDKGKAERYPDETIVPTGLVHFTSSTTYVVPEGSTTLSTALRWKCAQDEVGGPNTAPIYPVTDISHGPLGVGNDDWTDYGTPQQTWIQINAVDRTLATGIRLRVVGLPTATFLPSGTLYFLQVQNRELWSAYSTESICIQAVTAGKGFSMTLNELSKSDGVTLPYLPQGPMSFVFSDNSAEAAVLAGRLVGGVNSTVVSANGALIVVGFGLQAGTTVRVDYAHHIEYIPRPQAAGLIETKVELPSSAARDAISRGVQLVQEHLAGSTALGKVAPVVTGGGAGIVQSLTRAAVGLIPGAGAIVGVAKSAADALGAPPWLKTAMSFLG